jgi:hypothetical protein
MPNRRVPRLLADYVGPYREAKTLTEKVVEQCGLGKLMHDAGLTDFDPLIVVMRLVTEEILCLCPSLDRPKTRSAWCEAMRTLQQENHYLEHNRFIPCRFCDSAFEPEIDDDLLTLYLKWHDSQRLDDFLAIHRCRGCGGQLKALQTRKYKGDMHTPTPGSVQDDREWQYRLLHQGVGSYD